jgi:hypothetical protein
VLQTALDLIKAGYQVYVISNGGVSSCDQREIPVAMDRIRQAGGYVTTMESCVYEIMRSASIPQFKQIVAYVKEAKALSS